MTSPDWQVLFYRRRRRGGKVDDPVADFFASSEITDSERGQFETRLRYLSMLGLRALSERPDVLETLEGEDDLYALRLDNTQNNPRVLLCTLVGRRFVLLHAFKEKSSRDYKKAIRIARGRRDDVKAAEAK